MEMLNTKEHNFEVSSPDGIRLTMDNQDVVEFYEGDGFLVAARDDIPHIEFYLDEQPVSLKVEDKDIFSRILENVTHVDEYEVVEKTLLEASTDESITSQELSEAYNEARKEQEGVSNKTLSFVRRVKEMDVKSKASKVLESASVFKAEEEIKSLKVESVAKCELGE